MSETHRVVEATLSSVHQVFWRLRTQQDLPDSEIAATLNGKAVYRALVPDGEWTEREVTLWAKLQRIPRRPGPRR